MDKFKNDEIDKEYFKNDSFIYEFETQDEVEKYKSMMRDTYDYTFYRLNMTLLPYKISIGDWIEVRLCKLVDFISELISKIIRFMED